MPHLISIAYKPRMLERRPEGRFSRVAVDRAELVANHGIADDTKGKAGDRQLNVIFADAVEQLRAAGFRTAPGELGEQLVIGDLPTHAAKPGLRLRVGASAVVELMEPRAPCSRFAAVHGRPTGDAGGKLGFMARVLVGGEIAVGCSVQPEPEIADE